jgi:magnesium chelatase family protein
MDRIDLVVQVRALGPEIITARGNGDSTAVVRKSVISCREKQLARSRAGLPSLNSSLGPGDLREVCPLTSEHRKIMEGAMKNLGLTARGYHRILRVARTIADLEGVEFPVPEHLAEALQYRPAFEGPVQSF